MQPSHAAPSVHGPNQHSTISNQQSEILLFPASRCSSSSAPPNGKVIASTTDWPHFLARERQWGPVGDYAKMVCLLGRVEAQTF